MTTLTNLDKFWQLLKAANITDVKFVRGDGTVISTSLEEIQTRADVAAIISAYDPNPSAAELANTARVSAIQIKEMTPNQADKWFERQVHGADSETSLLTLVNNASSVNDLKPVLTKIVQAMYARTQAEETIIEMLLAVRDGKQ
jgi:hypothetical protein